MGDASRNVPLPPPPLADRVLGGDRLDPAYDPVSVFDTQGAKAKQTIRDLLSPGYSFEGRRFLDFGCGAGKLLRHLLPEAEAAEIYGCDIDEASISWLQRHLSPPLHVFVNDAAPPLPLPDAHFDLIHVSSVLTHITDHWSRWLIELHRLLKDDGLIIATVMGKHLGEAVASERFSEDETGMTVFAYGEDFTEVRQGPTVLHSEWWIREHWGRIFEIESFDDCRPGEQGVVTLRKKPVTLAPADLERADPGEPRELYAALRQIRQLQRELLSIRAQRDAEARGRRDAEAAHPSPTTSPTPDQASLARAERQLAALAVRMGHGAAEPPPPGMGSARRLARTALLRLLRPHTAHQEHVNNDVLTALASVIDTLAGPETAVATPSPGADVPAESSQAPAGGTASSQDASSPLARELREVRPIYPEWEALIPPRELWVMPLSWFEYFRWPFEYLAYLTLLCDLRSDASVLEIGCQTGRTMLGLHGYLRAPGRYEGLDVSAEHVAFAQAAMGGEDSIFNFTALDVYHSLYNPTGAIDPSEARLPYADASFDVVYAASVFTHLVPATTANYFRESARVLRPGGRCLFSFLVLEHYDAARAIDASLYLNLSHRLPELPGVGVANPEHPDALVGYEARLIKQLARAAGLRLERLLPGYWSATQAFAVNEHELVVLVKD